MYKIYKIKNKKYSHEIYVGSTKKTLKERLAEHVYDKRSSVYQYIQRDGRENFEVIAIDYAENKKDAIEKEIFWTLFLKEQGYFMYNKQAGTIPTEEIKEKNRIANTGKHPTEETRKKISEKAKERFKDPTKTPMYGKHHTEKTRKKMSEARKGENNPWFGKHLSKETKQKLRKKNGKAVHCTNDGKCFFSCTEAAEYYNIEASGIRKSCQDKLKFTKGLHFEYV